MDLNRSGFVAYDEALFVCENVTQMLEDRYESEGAMIASSRADLHDMRKTNRLAVDAVYFYQRIPEPLSFKGFARKIELRSELVSLL
jgi:hypothetical protein